MQMRYARVPITSARLYCLVDWQISNVSSAVEFILQTVGVPCDPREFTDQEILWVNHDVQKKAILFINTRLVSSRSNIRVRLHSHLHSCM